MAESTCLVHHTFSYPSSISNEAKQGDPLTHALGESISFGRFMTESLAWEKWSSFSHKRYVEEAERYAQPGSVAQKKAFFEAHYKRIAAKKKEEALLEQANAANTNPEPQLEGQDCYITTTDDSQIPLTNSQGPVGEQSKGKNIGAEIDSIVNFNGYNSTAELDGQEIGEAKRVNLVTGHEVLVESPMKDESLNKLENVVKQNMGSEMGPGESPLMEKPLLEGFKSSQEASSPASEKKPAFPSSIYSVHPRAPKVPPSPAKFTAFVHPRKDNDATPTTWKSPICSMNRQKSTSRSLHTLIYSTSVKEQDKSTTSIVPKAESSRVAPSRTSKYCKTPLKTPTMAYATGALKNPSATPCSENRRPKTPLHPSPSGSKTTGPKWKILSAVSSKSLSACRNKLQSPCSSAPFSFRTEERAARRKQNLEEKFTAKETQKVQLQSRLKEKAGTEIQKLRQSLCFKSRPLPDFYKERETPKNQIKNVKEKAGTEIRKLRQSLCFKARPLPDFYKERETPKNQINNVKTSLTKPQLPKLGRIKPSSNALQGTISLPPETNTTKNDGPKNVLKEKSRIPNPLTSLSEMITHENTSPNIQIDQQKPVSAVKLIGS